MGSIFASNWPVSCSDSRDRVFFSAPPCFEEFVPLKLDACQSPPKITFCVVVITLVHSLQVRYERRTGSACICEKYGRRSSNLFRFRERKQSDYFLPFRLQMLLYESRVFIGIPIRLQSGQGQNKIDSDEAHYVSLMSKN
jgi:hypothetical protein